MLIGHYGISMAARGLVRRPPVWVYLGAAQLLDIAWCVLVMVGVERYEPAPDLPGSTLAFTHYPYTHSLAAALLWSALATGLTRLSRYPAGAAATVGAVVFSHWILDFLVHRPDLPLWPGGPFVGLGLWNLPVVEQAAEIGLVLLGALLWAKARREEARPVWPALAFGLSLIGLFLAAGSGGDASNPLAVALSGLGFYLGVVLLGWLADRSWRRV